MANWASWVSVGGVSGFAFALSIGCSDTSATNGAGGGAGQSAQGGMTNGGGSAHGGTTSSGGAAAHAGTSSSAGATSIAGTSSGGSASAEGGASSAGASGAGDACSVYQTEAECKAAAGCYPLYAILPCPGPSAPCPSVFSACADTGCGPSCGPGSVCVGESSVGGAVLLPDDAGACPVGSHSSGQTCARDPVESFSCKPAPAACNGKITCACASSACNGLCQSAEKNQIDCVQYVP